jgi:hypothetical protein
MEEIGATVRLTERRGMPEHKYGTERRLLGFGRRYASRRKNKEYVV